MSVIEQRENSATSSNSGTTSNGTSVGFTVVVSDGLAKTVTCGSCGAEVATGADECMNCGAKLAAVIESTEEAAASATDEPLAEVAAEVATEEVVEEAACVEIEIEVEVDGEAVEAAEDIIDVDEAAIEESSKLPMWESELAFEGMATADGRYLIPGEISNRDLPLTLMCQYVTAEGHMGAEVCGKLTHIWRVDRPDLGTGVVAIMGSGEFSEDLMGPTAASLVTDQVLRGVSVDISPTRKALFDAASLQEIPEADIDFERYANGEYLVGIGGDLMGATLVPFPAFADASMRILSSSTAVTASAAVTGNIMEDGVKVGLAFDEVTTSKYFVFSNSDPGLKLIPRVITASAAGIAPLRPPRDWFFTPEPEGKFPLTVTEDGQIYGHLATWDQCHHGFANECVLAKKSKTDYALFHVGSLRTKEGEVINVGRIVVGDSGHASVDYGAVNAGQHYDKTGLVGAFVRAVDGKYGIWLSGAVRSDCPAERVRDMMANPPSGDWRAHNGWLELIAALSVPVPGFPVPRYEYALTASAEDVEVKSLVATGYYELEKPAFSRAELRRKELLLSKARGLTA